MTFNSKSSQQLSKSSGTSSSSSSSSDTSSSSPSSSSSSACSDPDDLPQKTNTALLTWSTPSALYRDGLFVTPGDVWVWGLSKPDSPIGATADADGHVCFPVKVSGLRNIVHVSASVSASSAVSAIGEAFTWGRNTKCRLLQPTEDAIVPVPTRVAALASVRVRTLHLSETHACAVLDNRTALLWGFGAGGALGNGDASAHTVAKPVTALLPDGTPMLVSQACVAYRATMLLLCDGRVFAAGANMYGRLGIASECVAVFTQVPLPPCRRISLGSLYTLALTVDHAVYAMGSGAHGNLGIGQRVKEIRKPTPVMFPDGVRVVHVQACREQPALKVEAVKECDGNEGPTSFAVDAEGHVWGWGTAHKGKMGNCRGKVLCPHGCDELVPVMLGGPSKDTKEPTHYFEGDFIVCASNTHINSAAIGLSGSLYSFGCGSDGRMGLDGFIRKGQKQRLKFYCSVPTPIETFVREKLRVTFAASSRFHGICIASK